MDVHTPEYEFEDAADLYVIRQTSPVFASFISKLISEMSMLTLLQSVKLLMLRYIEILPTLRLDDDDTASNDVVAICLRLAESQIKARHIH
ncbi:hypothetical protein TNCV_46431 [Trichonephila clavipes]|nr:hypothetical protein TNCV_46431 [Trichonephila clavipes]